MYINDNNGNFKKRVRLLLNLASMVDLSQSLVLSKWWKQNMQTILRSIFATNVSTMQDLEIGQCIHLRVEALTTLLFQIKIIKQWQRCGRGDLKEESEMRWQNSKCVTTGKTKQAKTEGDALKGKCLRLSWWACMMTSMVDCIKYHSYGDVSGWLHKKNVGGTRWRCGTYDKLEVNGGGEGRAFFYSCFLGHVVDITLGYFNIFQEERTLHGHAFDLYHIHVRIKLGILWILSWKYCKQVH